MKRKQRSEPRGSLPREKGRKGAAGQARFCRLSRGLALRASEFDGSRSWMMRVVCPRRQFWIGGCPRKFACLIFTYKLINAYNTVTLI